MSHELVQVRSNADWRVYHDIRRTVLFEGRGRFGIYSESYDDEFKPGNRPLLLKFNGVGIGTTRLDERGADAGVVRLVAVREDLQRRGHGRWLSRLVEEHATRLGMKTLYVNAAREALGFYDKMGWSCFAWDASELRDFSEDCIQMRKRLAIQTS